MQGKLLQIVRRLDTDYEPFGSTEHNGSDCSCGCRHFVKLAHEIGNDWGVCTNPESPRVGLLTFEHQGCGTFEATTVDPSLTDAQLRRLIGDASQLLQDRRRDRSEVATEPNPKWPLETGEFEYEVRTSYSPRINGHFPTLYRLERHEGSWIPLPLEAKVGGKERPDVRGRSTARNGDAFKIVRGNGDYSYQIPFDGKLHNLKQGGRISTIGLPKLEVLRPFLEDVESELFDKILEEAFSWPGLQRRWQDESRDRLRRWKEREFLPDEKPVNQAEYRQMLRDEEAELADYPNHIAESEALVEWLKGIDRSNPRLKFVACPSKPGKRPRQG